MHRDTIKFLATVALLILAAALVSVVLTQFTIPLELVAGVSLVGVAWLVVDRVVRSPRGTTREAATDASDLDPPGLADQVVSPVPSVSDGLRTPEADIAGSLEAAMAPPVLAGAAPVADVASVEGHAVIGLESVEPSHVVEMLTRSLDESGRLLSSGLWLEDAATATLRLVAGAGKIVPTNDPMPTDSGVVHDALRDERRASGPVADISDGAVSARVWRHVAPVAAGDGRGAFVVDLTYAESSDSHAVDETLVAWVPYLGAALELHVARHEASVARELIDAARELSRSIDAGSVLDTALERAVAMAEAETASIMLVGDGGAMSIVRSAGLPDEVVESTSVSLGEGIAGWVLATSKPLLVEDLPGHGDRSARRGVRSAVSVPICDEEGTIGVLNVGSRVFPARFTQAHLDAMEVLGRQACVAYRNALAVGEARDLYLSTLRTLSVAMETKDPYARGCTDRVLDGVSAVAAEMGLSEDDRRAVEVAALFHDMGMTAAGDGVRSQDRPLTTVERGLLKMHPAIAAEVLAEAPALRDVAAIVYHHHERFDGDGYVGGLEGTAIPIGARILAVVDSFVAMTSPRPYREAMDTAAAVDELREHAGTQFDPTAVEAFVRILGEEGIPTREDAR